MPQCARKRALDSVRVLQESVSVGVAASRLAYRSDAAQGCDTLPARAQMRRTRLPAEDEVFFTAHVSIFRAHELRDVLTTAHVAMRCRTVQRLFAE